MSEAPLTYGNAAKLYCLNLLAERVAAVSNVRILDLGCGDGSNFAELLRRHPEVHYVGVEPSKRSAEAARRTLAGLNADVIHAPAYDIGTEPADVVASFSVFEHVFRRRAYLACAARNLRPDGLMLVNYDAGHFGSDATMIDHVKTRLGRSLARLGREQYFQAPVRRAELRALAEAVGLSIVEEKVFNTDLKLVYRLVPIERRDEFMARWLEFELELNELGLEQPGDGARPFRTRNLKLVHGG